MTSPAAQCTWPENREEQRPRPPFAAKPIACFVALRRVSESPMKEAEGGEDDHAQPAPK